MAWSDITAGIEHFACAARRRQRPRAEPAERERGAVDLEQQAGEPLSPAWSLASVIPRACRGTRCSSTTQRSGTESLRDIRVGKTRGRSAMTPIGVNHSTP